MTTVPGADRWPTFERSDDVSPHLHACSSPPCCCTCGAGVTDALAQAAQASIAGAVRDASGAVLPGVTVEAASPALIEKVRTVTTDNAGQYRIEQLRTGNYTVTFTLPGFTTVKREGIELIGSFSATVNADMRVSGLEETVTVTGASPIVDVQSATRQRVIDADVLAAIPTGRTQFTAATLIPGMNLNNQDVGGTNIINTTGGSMTIHGSNGNDQRVMIDGLSTANSELAGNASNFLPNMGSAQEVAVDFSSGTADQATGGVRINIIPREGGNRFTGSLFATGANSSFQADNYSDDLRDRGLRTPELGQDELRHQPGVRRADFAGQAVVLQLRALDQDAELRRRHVLQRQRRASRTCGCTRPDPNRPGIRERVPAQRQHCD